MAPAGRSASGLLLPASVLRRGCAAEPSVGAPCRSLPPELSVCGALLGSCPRRRRAESAPSDCVRSVVGVSRLTDRLDCGVPPGDRLSGCGPAVLSSDCCASGADCCCCCFCCGSPLSAVTSSGCASFCRAPPLPLPHGAVACGWPEPACRGFAEGTANADRISAGTSPPPLVCGTTGSSSSCMLNVRVARLRLSLASANGSPPDLPAIAACKARIDVRSKPVGCLLVSWTMTI